MATVHASPRLLPGIDGKQGVLGGTNIKQGLLVVCSNRSYPARVLMGEKQRNRFAV